MDVVEQNIALEAPSAAAQEDSNAERDAVHILPLSIIPLDSAALKRARLIKNVQLQSVIEVFRGPLTGSGQYAPYELRRVLEWPEKGEIKDETIVKSLADLDSFDVFSLRVQLRSLGINVENHDDLVLSAEKRQQLTRFMVKFTRPLIRQIYGEDATNIRDVSQLIDLFKNPKQEDVVRNLKLMTESLNIRLYDIPRFLEDYGDIFLALAYYKDNLTRIEPAMDRFFEALEELRQNQQTQRDARLMETLEELENRFRDVLRNLHNRMAGFDYQSERLWENITADSFRQVRDMVRENYVTVGGILCCLTVKMRGWEHKFGNTQGRFIARGAYIMSDMRQGMSVFDRIEKQAPAVAI